MSSKVLIIGQGIAGTTLAFRCIQNGIIPAIIDPGMNTSASYVAVGLVNPISLKRVTPVWEVQSCLRSFHEFYRFLKAEMGVEFFVQRPIVKIFQTQSDLNNWTEKEDLPLYSDYLRSPESLSQCDEISGIAGGEVLCGGWVRTKELLSKSRSFFSDRSLLIEEEFELTDLSLTQNNVRYKGIEYDYIIDCSGSAFLLRDFFPRVSIVGNKGEVMTIFPEKFREDKIYSSTYFLLKHNECEYKVGATYSRSISNREPEEGAKTELVNGLQRFFTGKYAIKYMEAGIRPTVPDRKPIIGVSPIQTRVAMMNGLGSRGYLTAPLLSELLLSSLFHSKPIPHDVSCLRFLQPPTNNG